MRFSSIPRAGVLLVLMLALGACSQLKLGATAVKSVQGTEPAQDRPARAQGVYKVGDPYQIQGVWYYPAEDWSYSETGIASFYGGERTGTDFHGRLTANGELYDMNALTAAHTTLPMPSLVRVTNIENGRSIVLRVNDRGPFVRGRIIDVSRRAAQLLGFEGQGTARVKVDLMAEESRQLKLALTGRDENRTFAAVPRTEVASDALPPPPGARVSSGPVQSSALPPPSQILSGQTGGSSGNSRNAANNNARQTPLAQRAAPIPTQAANDPVPAAQTPAPTASSRGTPVVNNRAPATQVAQAAPPVSREVAALPVEQQALARPTLTQTAPRASTLWIQAGAFGNYENAYRLSVRLSRYGSTKVIPATINGAQVFRVRLGPIGDVAEADRVLATLGSEIPEARIVVD